MTARCSLGQPTAALHSRSTATPRSQLSISSRSPCSRSGRPSTVGRRSSPLGRPRGQTTVVTSWPPSDHYSRLAGVRPRWNRPRPPLQHQGPAVVRRAMARKFAGESTRRTCHAIAAQPPPPTSGERPQWCWTEPRGRPSQHGDGLSVEVRRAAAPGLWRYLGVRESARDLP